MRVSSCKFLCSSLICHPKSSISHCPPVTSELEDAKQEHAYSSPGPAPDFPEEKSGSKDIEVEKGDNVKVEMVLKSSFKRPSESGSKDVPKGRVKWMDLVGKELIEIKEFEASDSGDSDNDADGSRGCFCIVQ